MHNISDFTEHISLLTLAPYVDDQYVVVAIKQQDSPRDDSTYEDRIIHYI